MITNYSRQFLDKKDFDMVLDSLKSEYLTQGKYVNNFEHNLSKYFGAKYCSAVSNGTAALFLACKSFGWKAGDIILTTPNSFVATASAIESVGAKAEFVDIDKDTYNIDVNKLEDKLKKLNKKVKGIIAVDYAGQPCDWKAINFLARKFNLKTINDNCHAMGSSYYNSKKYAVKYADIVTQSYHPVKNLTTGEGGSVLTNNKFLIDKINKIKSHGITRERNKLIYKNNFSKWYYEVQELGYNFRISDINCALGISQLKKLDTFIKKKSQIADVYKKKLSDISEITLPKILKNNGHSFHLYPIKINFKKINKSKKKLFDYFLNKKYKLQVHYIPIHLHPYFKNKYKYKIGSFPIAENYYRDTLSIPNFFDFNKANQDNFVKLLKNYVIK